jgi:NTP pyrophosphatase (non-canonical NTP hydrolase)
MRSDLDDVSPEILAKTLNDFSKLCRSDNDKWWRRPNGRKLTRNDGELFMLMVSEVAEAMEGVRKDSMDDHLPHRKMVEVELADVLIRVFDYCGEHNLDIGGAFMEKRNYNAIRKDHSYAERSKPNGKKW